MDFFDKKFHIKVQQANAKERFLQKLKGIIDPEEKRKTIGQEFIRVFEEESKIRSFQYLAKAHSIPMLLKVQELILILRLVRE